MFGTANEKAEDRCIRSCLSRSSAREVFGFWLENVALVCHSGVRDGRDGVYCGGSAKPTDIRYDGVAIAVVAVGECNSGLNCFGGSLPLHNEVADINGIQRAR